MRILFFSHYYPPEVNAPAARTHEHCTRWAKAGHDVTVITCNPNCPDGVLFSGHRNRWFSQVEKVDGLRVVRVWTYLAANAGTTRRIANYLSYTLSSVLAALPQARPDVVVATTPQFFCAWAGLIAARAKRAPFVLEVRDLWPDSIKAVGAMKNTRMLRTLEAMERKLYRWSDHIVTVGAGYRDGIHEKGVSSTPITVISNGVDLERFQPREPDRDLLARWQLTDKFVCSYIGTIGMAHGLEVVIEAARLLKERGRTDVAFWMVGDGAERARLEQLAEAAGVADSVIFTGRQPRDQMPLYLASSGACLIHLRGVELFGSVMPSKIFETMAMQRPILMAVRGGARQLVEEAQAGVVIEPDDPQALADAVVELADDPGKCRQLGQEARAFVARHYDRSVLAQRYLELLGKVSSHRNGD